MSRRDEVREMLDQAMAAAPAGAPAADDFRAPADASGSSGRIASVTLAVRDLDAAARFYREVIGLQDVQALPGGAMLGAGGAALLTLLHRPDAQPDDAREAGLFHTAFLLPGRADLGAWLRHAARRGHALDGAADHLVSEAFYLHDPDGNGVEVYADRLRDAWRWEDGQVAMANANPDLAAILGAAAREWDGAPPGTTVGHVHLRVGDVAQAEVFYTGVVGLAVTRRWPGAAFMSTGGYHHHIAVNVWQSRGAGPRDPGCAGLAAVQVTGLRSAVSDPWGTLLEPAADR